MKCFFARSFHDEDTGVCGWFRSFLEAFDLTVVEAKDGTQSAIDQVETSLPTCDLFCAVMTKRRGAIPSWISSEVGMARNQQKTIIAFVEEGIQDLGCVHSVTEYKQFRRKDLGRDAPEYARYVRRARLKVLNEQNPSLSQLFTHCTSIENLFHRLKAILEINEIDRLRSPSGEE